MSVPNQKIIKINKHSYTRDFLQIGKDEWINAYQKLSPSAFAFYLYLAGNADGFLLELSMEATKNALGFSKATYDRAVSQLKKEGYLNYLFGNRYEFTLSPSKSNQIHNWETQNCGNSEVIQDESEMREDQIKTDSRATQNCIESESELNREIDNRYIKDNINKKDKGIKIDYSYLEEFILDDSYNYKLNDWMDGGDMRFWDHTKDYQKKYLSDYYGFTKEESNYIVENIFNSEVA